MSITRQVNSAKNLENKVSDSNFSFARIETHTHTHKKSLIRKMSGSIFFHNEAKQGATHCNTTANIFAG